MDAQAKFRAMVDNDELYIAARDGGVSFFHPDYSAPVALAHCSLATASRVCKEASSPFAALNMLVAEGYDVVALHGHRIYKK